LEGDDGALLPRAADDAQRIYSAQPLMGIFGELGLVRADARLADRTDIVDGRPQADRLHDRWRAGLELVRRLPIGDAVLEDLPDHLAAAVKRQIGRTSWRERV